MLCRNQYLISSWAGCCLDLPHRRIHFRRPTDAAAAHYYYATTHRFRLRPIIDSIEEREIQTMAHHEERFIPPRQKLDQLSVVKDYSAIPRLEYR